MKIENWNLKIIKKYNAFTFVELLLVIAIIGIMSAVGFASFNSGKVTTKLQAAQREVASIIKLTQSYALQGKVLLSGTTPCGYGVRFTDSTHYEIFYTPYFNTGDATITNCDQLNNKIIGGVHEYARYKAGTSQPLQSLALNNGVTLSDPILADIASTEIYFTIPAGNIYDKNGAAYTARTFTFNISGSTKTKTITIDSGGSITEQ